MSVINKARSETEETTGEMLHDDLNIIRKWLIGLLSAAIIAMVATIGTGFSIISTQNERLAVLEHEASKGARWTREEESAVNEVQRTINETLRADISLIHATIAELSVTMAEVNITLKNLEKKMDREDKRRDSNGG